MTTDTTLAAGDLVLVPFPFTDLSSHKVRPALMITNPDGDGDFIAVAVTSQSGRDGRLPLRLNDLASGGLAKDSHLRVDKMFTFHLSIIRKHIGSVKPDVVRQALTVLCPVLGCR